MIYKEYIRRIRICVCKDENQLKSDIEPKALLLITCLLQINLNYHASLYLLELQLHTDYTDYPSSIRIRG